MVAAHPLIEIVDGAQLKFRSQEILVHFVPHNIAEKILYFYSIAALNHTLNLLHYSTLELIFIYFFKNPYERRLSVKAN